ncbi:right-handed parallel beta-helix repeat-containing protein [Streptomyces sp. NPDC046977]|uniref:right-handed parallel beta-helix repeat-containing protein n=1 Tax=Streptomyces sp. NPDC046977 TaxID=3154703 RepID=UPI0033C83672
MKRNVLRVAADRGWGTHRSITAAVRAAEDGAAVHVQPGVYRESLVLDRDVAIVAEKGPGSVRIVAVHGTAVTVTAGVPRLRDVAVEGTSDREPAVFVGEGRAVLDHCHVIGGRVEVVRNAVAELRSCVIEDSSEAGLPATGTANVVLEDCAVRSVSGHGLTLSDAAVAKVLRVTIERVTGFGVAMTGESVATFEDCTVRQTGDAALVVATPARPVLRGCRLHDAKAQGVRVVDSSVVTASAAGAGTDDAATFAGRDGLRTKLEKCEIFRTAGEGVLVAGAAELSLQDCHIRETGGAGVIAAGTSRVELAGTRVVDLPGTGLAAVDTAQVHIRGGTVARTGANGVHGTDNCTIRLADCEISTTGYTALHFGGRAQAELHACTVRDSAQHAIWAEAAASVLAEDVRIERAGMTGVEIRGADAVLRRCVITEAETGVRLQTSHRPLLDGCEVTQCGGTGIEVAADTGVVVRGGRVESTGSAGVFLDERSEAWIDDLTIADARGIGLVIWSGARPRVRSVTVAGAAKNGVYAGDGAEGLLEDCTVSATGYPAVYVGSKAAPLPRRCLVRDTDEDLSQADDAAARFEQCASRNVKVTTMPAAAEGESTLPVGGPAAGARGGRARAGDRHEPGVPRGRRRGAPLLDRPARRVPPGGLGAGRGGRLRRLRVAAELGADAVTGQTNRVRRR